jgi:NADH-quinone oxidoreductase subunit N
MAVGTKAAAFAALIRVLAYSPVALEPDWTALFWWASVLTMTTGNVVALLQTNLKRMLAYSAIAHAGYILVGIVAHEQAGVAAVLFYIVVYALMNLGAFCIVLSLSRRGDLHVNLEDYAGLGRTAPLTAAALAVFLLSLAGLPLTGGFIGKFYLFAAAIQRGYVGLAVLGVLNSLLSVFYYFRVLVWMYMREAHPDQPLPDAPSGSVLAITVLSALATIWLGIRPEVMADLANLSALILK